MTTIQRFFSLIILVIIAACSSTTVTSSNIPEAGGSSDIGTSVSTGGNEITTAGGSQSASVSATGGSSDTIAPTGGTAASTGGAAATGGYVSASTGGDGTGGSANIGGGSNSTSVTTDCSISYATLGQPCCLGSCLDPQKTTCNTVIGTSGFNTCLACGGANQPCCIGNVCNGTNICNQPTSAGNLPMCAAKVCPTGTVGCSCLSNGTCNTGTCTGHTAIVVGTCT
jgi:hypothetical protein